ncbi:MAG: N-acetyltransferase [Sulfobacillus thermosulfidooxidans]|uniref:GNAT family N-acetyltransferase n=1 Tax=Sulfobacillus thermotolerans TaxID=338644 RepID=A0ABM6RTU0_9FIRM|nr:GNAT family N-acetyltransferase [Sulfobacillus sp. hq2]AUW94765.1 GNAT family N-acetyltransferase [Sulfobacillus thermotolerans]MCY0907863.1 GNAT family N-acetyltransferase [Sulfobacillus thermotolerans]POB09774.1 GNAT family N-acetyltransferase [Sulfobacillus sp. hq2]PSR38084.1 MAG: N-acetyltransferase [Sulfobacillus thermosulfidooxidans]
MQIRPYRPQQDYRAVLNAQCDLYKINFPRFVCTPAFLAEQAQRLRAAAKRPFENGIFVLEDGLDFAGFVWVAIRMDLQGTYGSVDQVYLQEAYRRRGLGKLLMDTAQAFVLKQGIKVARLYVTAENHDAVKLYEREGYTVTRLEMEKPLAE